MLKQIFIFSTILLIFISCGQPDAPNRGLGLLPFANNVSQNLANPSEEEFNLVASFILHHHGPQDWEVEDPQITYIQENITSGCSLEIEEENESPVALHATLSCLHEENEIRMTFHIHEHDPEEFELEDLNINFNGEAINPSCTNTLSTLSSSPFEVQINMDCATS